jgi:preprotein translocase subunit YajC
MLLAVFSFMAHRNEKRERKARRKYQYELFGRAGKAQAGDELSAEMCA